MSEGDAIHAIPEAEPEPTESVVAEAPVTPPHLAALGVTLGLAACGGGGGTMATPAAPSPPPAAPMPTRLQAARFLGQAAVGSSKANVDAVAAQGYDAWLDAQFAMPRAISHWDWLVQAGYATTATQDNQP